jgi:hypothetical protein
LTLWPRMMLNKIMMCGQPSDARDASAHCRCANVRSVAPSGGL